MKNKIRIPLMFLITIMLAGLVSAVGIFTDPATSDTISGTYRFNINSSLTNTLNCSITGSSALGGDTLTTTWLYNMSHTNESANASIDTTAFNDAIDWTFTGNCYNGTGGGYNTTTVTTVSSVTVNNTLPTCNLTSSQASDNEYLPTASWTVNCSRATGATIAFNGNTYLMTKTSDTCS